MNRFRLFVLVLLSVFIVSCSTVTTEISKPPAKEVPSDRTIFAKDVWLGIVGRDTPFGVEVTDIYINSSAKDTGVKKNDVLIEIDNKNVSNIDDVLSVLGQKESGNMFNIKVSRHEETIEIVDSVSKTQTTISKEDFLKKYQGFKDEGKPGERMEFTVQKKAETKELTVTLTTPPERFHLIEPPQPVTEPKPEIKDGKKAGWMGISMGPVKGLAKMGMDKEQGGIKINSVSPASPAEKGGLKTGDIVISYDGNTFSGEEPKYQEKMAEHIKSVGSGGVVALTVLRAADEIVLMINDKKEPTEADKVTDVINNLKVGDRMKAGITRNIKNISLKITLGTRMAASDKPEIEPETNEKIHPELVDYTTPIEILTQKILSHTNITDKYEDLLKRYSDDQKNADDFRLRDMRYLERDPFKIPKICDDLIVAIRNNVSTYDNDGLLETISARLDEVIFGEDITPVKLKAGLTLEEHCKQIEELLTRAEKYRKEA
ncbi:MAG: PDZ domain-containing protein, partial [Planctomycetota bacterium]